LGIIGDLQNDKGILDIVSVPSDTALGGLKGSDSFSKFTESYVNCNSRSWSRICSYSRGFGDILRLSDKR
jgi:aspartokinase/homoserine dehydrogenase 1